jgi:NAD(P)-dependent dehydrogenase (short-subunit alcohol dehydrogenase family)
VVVGYAANDGEAKETVADAEAKGARTIAISAGVADEGAVAKLFDAAEHTFGGVDVVVNAAAVEAMTFILAHELRGRDVTANAVAPGPTATDMFLEGKDEELLRRLASAVPLERLGTPADTATVVAFLASPAGHWINGQTIRVNGGVN